MNYDHYKDYGGFKAKLEAVLRPVFAEPNIVVTEICGWIEVELGITVADIREVYFGDATDAANAINAIHVFLPQTEPSVYYIPEKAEAATVWIEANRRVTYRRENKDVRIHYGFNKGFLLFQLKDK